MTLDWFLFNICYILDLCDTYNIMVQTNPLLALQLKRAPLVGLVFKWKCRLRVRQQNDVLHLHFVGSRLRIGCFFPFASVPVNHHALAHRWPKSQEAINPYMYPAAQPFGSILKIKLSHTRLGLRITTLKHVVYLRQGSSPPNPGGRFMTC